MYAISYIHPSFELQKRHDTSLTRCRPVSMSRMHASSSLIFHTFLKRYAFPDAPWNRVEMRFSLFVRNTPHFLQLYIKDPPRCSAKRRPIPLIGKSRFHFLLRSVPPFVRKVHPVKAAHRDNTVCQKSFQEKYEHQCIIINI
ncbi:hypothetical protein PMAYCL1PPCAC_18220 [Pristionchus mayeri]|uniref:Uncharacterized protein n=1 Tax=Pristionchus mayeri TaxID=1317129 RepID=A0AAN5CPH1_9BILA|nr:hypothetical protein PMAYCL1PPCAC_18220 [Pristionchus mayeri]